eukprot:scaffold339371_cov37-Prasinocladus_malaysianus.AAC.1
MDTEQKIYQNIIRSSSVIISPNIANNLVIEPVASAERHAEEQGDASHLTAAGGAQPGLLSEEVGSPHASPAANLADPNWAAAAEANPDPKAAHDSPTAVQTVTVLAGGLGVDDALPQPSTSLHPPSPTGPPHSKSSIGIQCAVRYSSCVEILTVYKLCSTK